MKNKQIKRVLAGVLAVMLAASTPMSTLAADKDVDSRKNPLTLAQEDEVEEQQTEAETETDGKVADVSKLTPMDEAGVQTTDDLNNEGKTAVDGDRAAADEKGITFEQTDEKASAELKNSSAKKLEAADDREDKVRVIILMKDKSILERDSDAVMNWYNRIRINRIEAAQDSVVSKIEDKVLDGEEMDVRYQYTWALNGVAAEVPEDSISEIEAIPGVEKVVRTSVYSVCAADEESAISPYTIGDGEMIGREDTWANGYTGKGMRISIIDTGLDNDHPSFAALQEDQLTDTSATVATVDKVIGDLNASTLYSGLTADKVYRSTKVPYAFNYVDENLDYTHNNDQQGEHGTHVAGIAAANELESAPNGQTPSVGVAPEAQLYVMKVFGANGGAYTDDLLAAVEDSLILGADVINMSLGSPAGFTSEGELLDEVYGRVSESNTILAVAAGNSSTVGEGNHWGNGLNLISNPDNSTVSSPATFVNATSVASVDNARMMSNYVEVNGRKLAYEDGSKGLNASFATLGGQEIPFAMVANAGQSEEDFAAADVAGKIAVVQRGVTAFTAKCQMAEDAGAVACLIYNNVSGTISMDMTDGTAVIPCASITMAAGEQMAAALAENPEAKLLVSEEPALIPSETAYQMSSFSSWGISPDLSLEPEVTAPGGNIYSTLDGGGYGLMSGTSMASPNMAGVSALVSQYVRDKFPKMSASEQHVFINALIMSTAMPLMYDKKVPYSPRSQGSGLVNAYDAVTTGSYLSVDGVDTPKAELKDDPEKTGAYSFSFHVNNFSKKNSYYALSTNAQTEGITYYDSIGRGFMSGTPVALSAATAEDSAQMILTLDYNGDGSCTAEDVTVLRERMQDDMVYGADAFRYDVNGDDVCDELDIQAYEAALAGENADVDLDAKVLQVKAGTTADVNVTVNLTEKDRKYLDGFDNGIYVEGFTTLTALSAGSVDLSLPYLAFYGDWTQAPMIDTGYYWEDEETMEANQYYNILWTNFGSNDWMPGLNAYVDEAFDPRNIALSPNGDGFADEINEIYVSLLRNAKTLHVTYRDADTGAVYFDGVTEDVAKSYLNQNYGICIPFMYTGYMEELYHFTDKEGNPLPNNTHLIMEISGELDYAPEGRVSNNVSNSWETAITIDTEAPALKDAKFRTEEVDGAVRKLLTLTFADNQDTAAVNILNKSGKAVIAQYAVDDVNPGEDCTMTFDVTGVGNQFMVVLSDYALNESTWKMYTEDNDPVLDTSALYAYRVADDQIQDDTLYGWMSINPDTAAEEVMSSEYYMDYSLIAAEYVGGYIIAVDANKDLVAIRPGYWDSRTKIASLGVNISDLAFDPVTKTLYGYDSNNYRLVKIDIYTGELTTIGNAYMAKAIAMACDDNGVLYGIKADTNGSFCTINKETGTWNEVLFNTSKYTGYYNPKYSQAMTWDSEKQCLYWASYYYSYMGAAGNLYQINPADMSMSKAGKISGNSEVVGLLKLDDRGYTVSAEELASISLTEEKLTLLSGMSEDLEVLRNPWNSDDINVTWTSEDEAVATVSPYGSVTAAGVGSTTVTASVEGRPELTASCRIEVVDPQADLNAFVLAGNTMMNQWISFKAGDMSAVEAKTEMGPVDFYAGEYYDGYIYAFSSAAEMYKINAQTYEAVKVSESRTDYTFQDMAFDYTSGYMYALAQNVDPMAGGVVQLLQVDLMTGDLTVVADNLMDEHYNQPNTLAIAGDGTMYMTTLSGFLFTFNKETQELVKVGGLGYTPSTYSQTMTCDQNTGDLYMALITSSSLVSLVYIDRETGKALPLGAVDNGAQLTALYAVPDEIPERPEVAVENVSMKADSLTLLVGGSKVAPVQVLPYNATDRNIAWTVADPAVASITDNMVTGLQKGETTATGTLGDTSVTFKIKVLESAGDMYGYVITDLAMGNGLFWGTFKDNDLSAGQGIAGSSAYEVYAGEYYDGKIYGIGPDEETYEWQFMQFDAETYELEKVVTGDYPDMRDMAFDYTEGVMYGVGGIRNVEGNNTLYMMDISNGGCYEIAKLDTTMATLACTDEGQLCGVSQDGIFYWIDKATGEITEVFDTGYLANTYQSMAYDRNTGNLYWAQTMQDIMAWTNSAEFLIVDPELQSVTRLGHIGTNGCMLSALHTIPKEAVEIAAPKVQKVLLGTSKKMLKAGSSFTLTATPYPLSVAADNISIRYESENPDVATVDENGVVTAVAGGTAVVRACCGDVYSSCTVNVVDETKKLYVVTPDGWQTSPLLDPMTVEDVSLPADSGLSIKAATLHTDGYFYAVDSEEEITDYGSVFNAQNKLWRFTENGAVVEKLSENALTQWLALPEGASNPVIHDIQSNGQNLYLLTSAAIVNDGEMYASSHYYIHKLDLENEKAEIVQEIDFDTVGRPIRFSFRNETECYLYDAYQDYIFKMDLTNAQVSPVAWPQGVFVASDTMGMAYSKELDMIFVATKEDYYARSMGLYTIDPYNGKVELFSNAAYSEEMQGIILNEGIALATGN